MSSLTVRAGTDITADSAFGNDKKKILHATGHVIVHQHKQFGTGADSAKVTQEPSTLTCDKLEIQNKKKIYQTNAERVFKL